MKLSKKTYWLLFGAILLLAAILRFYKLGSVPVSLYWDEVAMLVDAKTVAATGLDQHSRPWFQPIYPSYGDFKMPVYIWLASISVKLFGVGEWQLRLPSALAGLGTVVLVGLMAIELFCLGNEKSKVKSQKLIISLSAMLMVAISPWDIMFSRTGFEGHLAQFILGASAYLLLLSRKLERWWLILPATILASLATYTYFSVRFVWPVLLIITILTSFRLPAEVVGTLIRNLLEKQNFIKFRNEFGITFLKLFLSLLLFYLALIPMFKADLYAWSNQYRLSTDSVLNCCAYAVQSNILREQAGNSLFERIIFHRDILLLKNLAHNYSKNLSLDFLFLTGDQNLRHGTGEHGLFSLVTLPLLIAGFYFLAKNNWRSWLILVTWWLISLLPASVPMDTPHALRTLNALIPISIIFGFGLFTLIKSQKKLIVLIYFGLLFVSSFQFSSHYFKYYKIDSASEWQDGYKQMATEIFAQKDEVQIVLVESSLNRVNLWLMAYFLTPAQIQNNKTDGFGVSRFENIYFDENDWSKFFNEYDKILYVGSISRLQEVLSQNKAFQTLEVKQLVMFEAEKLVAAQLNKHE